MKKHYLFLILCFIGHYMKAQNGIHCNLLPQVTTNSGVKFYLKEITEEEYKSNKLVNPNELDMFTNSDSIEVILEGKYPKLFRKIDGKYTFKTYEGQDIVVRNNLVQEKEYSKYTFKAQFEKYVIIFQEFYEGAQSIVIDTHTKTAYSLPDKPYFITTTLVYSYGSDYGISALTITDLEKNENISFAFDEVQFVDTYNISSHIRFEVFCSNSNEYKYLEILKY